MRAEALAQAPAGQAAMAKGLWGLPEGWVWAPASSFAQIVGGGTPQVAWDPRNFEPEGIPWLPPADLSGISSATIHRGACSLSRFGFERK